MNHQVTNPPEPPLPLRVLFVHGMGRSPLSGLPVLMRLRAAGFAISTFGYTVALRDFASTRDRLRDRLVRCGTEGRYVVVGHSLGGVLLRSALAQIPAGARPPEQLFLLGSPIRPSRLAKRLQHNPLYRAVTGDCGQLLASEGRMAGVGVPKIPTTTVIGVRSLRGLRRLFGEEPNDGIVAVSEVQAGWAADEVRVPVSHSFLPASCRVAEALLARLERLAAGRPESPR